MKRIKNAKAKEGLFDNVFFLNDVKELQKVLAKKVSDLSRKYGEFDMDIRVEIDPDEVNENCYLSRIDIIFPNVPGEEELKEFKNNKKLN